MAASPGPDKQSEVVWYPSGDWHGDKGVLVGAYAVGWLNDGDRTVREYSAMSFADRFAVSRGVIERLHPGKSALLEKPLTVAWDQTPWNSGVGAQWSHRTAHDRLCRAGAARGTDLLRRRASELSPLLAGRRGGVGAQGDRTPPPARDERGAGAARGVTRGLRVDGASRVGERRCHRAQPHPSR